MNFSIIIPSIMRPQLVDTLRSIRAAGVGMQDEVLVVFDSPGAPPAELQDALEELSAATQVMAISPLFKLGGWGGPGRNHGISEARGSHLLFIDDDDTYEPAALDKIRGFLQEDPDAIHVWRMVARGGHTLWGDESIRQGNIGTPMFAVPRKFAGTWTTRYEGDFDFVSESARRAGDRAVWHTDVLVRCG